MKHIRHLFLLPFLIVSFFMHVLRPTSDSISLDDLVKKEKGFCKEKPVNLRQQIALLNHASIKEEERNWSSWSYYEFLSKSIRNQADPLLQIRQETAFKMIASTPYAETTIVRDHTTWQDLYFFAGKKAGDNYVGKELNRTKTDLGFAQFLSLLGSSTQRKEEIELRQSVIKHLLEKKTLTQSFHECIDEYVQAQHLFTSNWQEPDFYLQAIDRGYLFNDPILKNANGSHSAIWTKYIWYLIQKLNGLVSNANALKGLTLFVLSSIIDSNNSSSKELKNFAHQYHKRDLLAQAAWEYGPTTTKYAVAALSAYFIYASFDDMVENVTDSLMFEEILHLKLVQVSTVFKALKKIATLLEQDQFVLEKIPTLKAIHQLFSTTQKENGPLHDFINLILSPTFEKNADPFFQNRGKIILGYLSLHMLKDQLLPALQAFGLLDAFIGIAELLESEPNRFCFAEIETSTTPHIFLENFTNPLVPSEKSIPNTIELGSTDNNRNCILTGPNAGGKSTLIKAIGINVLLAQSIGITAAKRCAITPFSIIATYLNITDDVNVGNSLLVAEVLRTQELINALQKLSAGECGLLIFDEVFNGTTPLEGSAMAKAVAEFLGKIPNGMAIIATHFQDLTELANDATIGYTNLKMSVHITRNGSLIYPFTLEPGISNQHVAIDILRSEGYADSVVDRASEFLAHKVTATS